MDIIWMVNVVFRKDTDGCDWDIAYSGIQVVQCSLFIAVKANKAASVCYKTISTILLLFLLQIH